MKRRIIASLMLVLLVLPGHVHAWSAGGHRIIAFIAWLQLDPEMRAKAVDTIKHHVRFAEDFVDEMPSSVASGTQEMKDQWVFRQAAVWPDIRRGFSGALVCCSKDKKISFLKEQDPTLSLGKKVCTYFFPRTENRNGR